MSQEKVLETLESLGLTKSDAQVYLFLGKRGPQKAKDISRALKMPRQTLYPSIKDLQSKGIIAATLEHPAKFSAVPFEKVLDLFVRAKTEEIQQIEADKKTLLSDWQSITFAETTTKSPKFSVIEGRNFIYSRLKQMIEESKSQLFIVSTISGLMRAEQYGLLDAALSHVLRTNTEFRFLTEVTSENLKATKQLLSRIPNAVPNVEGRTPERDLKPFSRMLIKDDAEVAFFISRETNETSVETDELCLWTNSYTLVRSFKTVFEGLWQNSINIESRITEIETGKQSTRMLMIDNEQAAKNIYKQALNAARKEIIILTTSKGILTLKEENRLPKKNAQTNLSVKIMFQITRENLEVARELSKSYIVRHISSAYPETTIVDDKHSFQFREKPPDRKDTFYTNDPEQVKRTKNMLTSFWQSARIPPALNAKTNKSILALSLAMVSDDEYSLSNLESPYRKMSTQLLEEGGGHATEEEILQKIINAKKYPTNNWPKRGILRFYGSAANAVLTPPKYLKLPSIIINAYDWNEDSSFGRQKLILFYLALQKPKSEAYTQMAVITDNQKSIQARKFIAKGTPAEDNVRLAKKDQLQVKVHGNTAFVGWTVPIPLSSRYVLPPAGILVEGYGKLKTAFGVFKNRSGVEITLEGNAYDAFVTFYHPTPKNADLGTDGMVVRDQIATFSVHADKS